MKTSEHPILSLYIIAGEPSGDVLGARLMQALKQEHQGQINFFGIGGPRMSEQGLKSLFPMSELSIMGLTEIIPHIPKLLGRITETVEDIQAKNPSALITIDSPAFSLRVSKKLKGKGIPLIHYVAPSVWAWKPGRAKKVARYLDHLLALLPFEPPYFEVEGLSTSFVGHSILESGADQGSKNSFRAKHSIPLNAPLLCLLPGSRSGEIKRLLPVFEEALALIHKELPDLHLVLPTIERQANKLREATENWTETIHIIEGIEEKYDAFAASDVALAASGTVALELAMASTPMVITYKVNPITHFIVRKMVKTKFGNLTNILLQREVIPELIQGDCTASNVASRVKALFQDKISRQRQIDGFKESLSMLGLNENEVPSVRAAKSVLTALKNYKGVKI
ncbi:MAG: lipid-A-disaccharide synthase [Rhodospirillales bacterium]|nr:lipid-A-disaccharide synthase [Rhodospirillales bacterium]